MHNKSIYSRHFILKTWLNGRLVGLSVELGTWCLTSIGCFPSPDSRLVCPPWVSSIRCLFQARCQPELATGLPLRWTKEFIVRTSDLWRSPQLKNACLNVNRNCAASLWNTDQLISTVTSTKLTVLLLNCKTMSTTSSMKSSSVKVPLEQFKMLAVIKR